MARIIKLIENHDDLAADLPLFRGVVPITRTVQRKSAQKFVRAILMNEHIAKLLERINQFEHETWLTAGCLAQTVWNVKSGRNAKSGIDDYDLIYFDEDTRWETEDRIIRQCADLYSDVVGDVQIRNQARVPLWDQQKFGLLYPPVKEAPHSVRRFPSRATAFAISVNSAGDICIYAPFGFKDTWDLLVRPNRRLDIPDVYQLKTGRWAETWPDLRVVPWAAASFVSHPINPQ